MTRSLRCSDPNLFMAFLSTFGADAKWLSKARMLWVLGMYPASFSMWALRKSCAAWSASKHAMSYSFLERLPLADFRNMLDFFKNVFTASSELIGNPPFTLKEQDSLFLRFVCEAYS